MKRYLLVVGLLFAGCSYKNSDIKVAYSVSELAKQDGITEVAGFKTTTSKSKCKKVVVKKVIEAKDSDLDGVPDIKDKCPNTPHNLQVNPEGCPVLATLYLQFDTDKAKVKKIFYPELKRVAEILKANPKLKIEVDGHTDNRGSREYNLKLSQRRAKAVKDVLVNYFHIAADRIVTKGYGEDYPLVPNTTQTNMALNRRVEIVALNNKYHLKSIKPVKSKEFRKTEKKIKKTIKKDLKISNVLNDNDFDGIIDQNDKCPNTPLNVKVNERGCEILYSFFSKQLKPSDIKSKYSKEINKIASIIKNKKKVEVDVYIGNVGKSLKDKKSLAEEIANALKKVLQKDYGIKNVNVKGLISQKPFKGIKVEVSKL